MIRGVNPLLFVGDFPGLVVTESSYNLNLRELWDAANPGMTPVGPIRITIASGVVIGSDSTDNPALVTGSWPGNVTLELVNNGRVQGRGGNGAAGSSSAGWRSGNPGGPAFQASQPIIVDNVGEIWGGGGGGAGSPRVSFSREVLQWEGGDVSEYYCVSGSTTMIGGGGGGGAGANPGPGGVSGGNSSTPAAAGTATTGGNGGTPRDAGQTTGGTYGPCTPWDVSGAAGRRGGGPGEPGVGGSGGAAGAAVIGNNHITWIAEGDRRGPIT